MPAPGAHKMAEDELEQPPPAEQPPPVQAVMYDVVVDWSYRLI
jgi:hypothetical protein